MYNLEGYETVRIQATKVLVGAAPGSRPCNFGRVSPWSLMYPPSPFRDISGEELPLPYDTDCMMQKSTIERWSSIDYTLAATAK